MKHLFLESKTTRRDSRGSGGAHEAAGNLGVKKFGKKEGANGYFTNRKGSGAMKSANFTPNPDRKK